MILIVGPAFSGKREYAGSILSGMAEQPAGKELPRKGSHFGAGVQAHDKILTEVQEMVTEEMDEASLAALADSLCERASILTASETGAGIVPVDGSLRKKREKQGRFLAILSGRADCVIRVFYGLPEVLKGSLTKV